jgi:CPA2 family monovalent cation:H+ antiporter-2
MEHTLINTVVASVVGAFVFGLLAKKLKLPAILGYLFAGILIGPHTPGFVADVTVAQQLAEIGVIMLMFGVGMHFSLNDLLMVRKVALPGALFQMFSATVIGALLVKFMGLGWMSGLLFGFALSVASTVVLLRALEHRNLTDSDTGKIAIGWLIVEDIAMVLALVLLPVLAQLVHTQSGDFNLMLVVEEVVKVTLKIGAFAVLMIVGGRRLLPVILVYAAKTRSQELTSLAALALALGFAFVAYALFGASFALGAFLAGLVLNESEIGHKAAEQSLPMRDIFAVLFFVSVGMLFDPMVLVEHPLPVLATLLVIIIGKSAAALLIMRLFRRSWPQSALIAVSLAQIGEFSFIFASMAVRNELMEPALFNFILAGALLSIGLNHFLFKYLEHKGFVPGRA